LARSFTKIFTRLSLSSKISVLFSLLITAVAIFVNLYFPARREEQALNSMIGKARYVGEIISITISDPMKIGNKQLIDQELNSASRLHEIHYLVAFNESGKVIGSFNISNAFYSDFVNTHKGVDYERGVIKIKVPVKYQDVVIGSLYVGLSLSEMQREVQSIRYTIGILSLIILVGGIFIIFILVDIATKPLREIVDAVKKISAGNLDKRARVVYDDEIGDLAKSFNEMVANVQSANQKLEVFNKSLEQLVGERTRALQIEVNEHKRTAEALRRSQSQLLREQKIFMGGPTIVYRIKEINDVYTMEYISSNIIQYGYTRDDMMDSSLFLSIIHPDDLERMRLEILSAIHAKIPNFESYFRMIKRDGDVRNVYSFTTVVRDGEGEFTHFDGYFIDITDGKKAENALLESESRFRTIFDKAGVGMVLTDIHGRIFNANEAFQIFIGFSLTELKTKSIIDISHPDDIEEEVGRFKKTLQDGSQAAHYQLEKRYIHKSGSIIWGRLTSTFIRDLKGAILFGFGTVEDITRRRVSENIITSQNDTLKYAAKSIAALLTNYDYLASLHAAIKTLGEGIKVDRAYIFESCFDEERDIALLQKKALWARDGEVKPLLGKEIEEMQYNEVFTRWNESFSKGDSIYGLVKNFPEKERTYLLEWGIKSIILVPIAIRKEFGGFLGLDLYSEDHEFSSSEDSIFQMVASSIGGILEREKVNRELIAAKERAVESDKLKSTLLSNMSHEFRTPMNGILGFAELLSDELEDSLSRQMARNILDAGHRLMTTLDTILDLSQLESRKIQVALTDEKLVDVLQPMMSRYVIMAEQKKLTFEYLVFDENIYVSIDVELLRKVMHNIIENAIKFTKSGGISVEISSEMAEDGSLLATVSVRDTGIGISPEHQKIIFQEFRQVSEGWGRGYEGSGLGLSVAKRMVTLLGGDIILESEVGHGSEFKIVFSGFHPTDTFPVKNSLKQKTPANKAISVLLVEDNFINKDMTTIFLKGICSIDYAETGEQAIELTKKKVYDIILMDINLGSGMNGVEATSAIRLADAYRDVPIVALTGFAMAGDRESFLAQGFSHYICKPFDRHHLLQLINSIF
jgi:PAS domain S-box-containing protein